LKLRPSIINLYPKGGIYGLKINLDPISEEGMGFCLFLVMGGLKQGKLEILSLSLNHIVAGERTT
jgi:hypothetical protein